MGDASKKSIGTLFDELITVVVKCFFSQEEVMKGGEDVEVAVAAKKAQQLNARRNELIRAIDSYFGDENAPSPKTYAVAVADGKVMIEERRIDEIVTEYMHRHSIELGLLNDNKDPRVYWRKFNGSRLSQDFYSATEAVQWAWVNWVRHDAQTE